MTVLVPVASLGPEYAALQEDKAAALEAMLEAKPAICTQHRRLASDSALALVAAEQEESSLVGCELRVHHSDGALPAVRGGKGPLRRVTPLQALPALKRDLNLARRAVPRVTSDRQILLELMMNPMNLMLAAAPVGAAGSAHGLSNGAVFSLCFCALVPLAKLLGDATEHLSENLNQTIGGLLNATFGNAVEMIITINAIKGGLLDIVKNSLLGSILSNLLLVLGMAFFAGGIARRQPKFSGAAALINITMLLVSVMSFSLPTVFSFGKPKGASLDISRVSAGFVSVGYIAYLVFQLHTHVEIFEDGDELDDDDGAAGSALEAGTAEGAEVIEGADKCPGDDGVLSVPCAMTLLLISTAAVAVLSEVMVGSIDGMTEQWGVPRDFVGVILLPIVGNACEHASAVRLAYSGKMAASIAIAVGSSTQIAMFVMPFSVIAGWLVGQPLDLDLGPTALAVLFLSVLVVFSIVMDGKSNWLEGFLLTLAYCLVAVLYWNTDL